MVVSRYYIVRPSLTGLLTWSRSERNFYGHDTDECNRQAVRWLNEWKSSGIQTDAEGQLRLSDVLVEFETLPV